MSNWLEITNTFINLETMRRVGDLSYAQQQAASHMLETEFTKEQDNARLSHLVDLLVKIRQFLQDKQYLDALISAGVGTVAFRQLYPQIVDADTKLKASDIQIKLLEAMRSMLSDDLIKSSLVTSISQYLLLINGKMQETIAQLKLSRNQFVRLNPDEEWTIKVGEELTPIHNLVNSSTNAITFHKGRLYKVIEVDTSDTKGFYLINDLGQKSYFFFRPNGRTDQFGFFDPPLASWENEIVGWELLEKLFSNEFLIENLKSLRSDMLYIYSQAFEQVQLSRQQLTEGVSQYKLLRQNIVNQFLQAATLQSAAKSKKPFLIAGEVQTFVIVAILLIILIIGLAIVTSHNQTEPRQENPRSSIDELIKINVDNRASIEDGISKMQKELGKNPNNPGLWYSLGRAYLYDHDTIQALSIFRKPILLELTDTTVLIEVGTLLLGKDNLAAIEAFKKLVRESPNNRYGYQMLSTAYKGMNNYQQALQYDEKALELGANDPISYLGIATSYYRLGEFDKAIVIIKKAMRLDPNPTEAKCLLGSFYATTCNFSDAEGVFHDILEKKSNSTYVQSYACLGLADIFILRNDLYSAETLLSTISNDDSTILGAKCLRLGRIMEKRNQIDSAKICYLRSVLYSKQMIHAYAELGMMLINQGKTEEGRSYLKTAKGGDSTSGSLDYKKALILYSHRKTEQAIELFRLASLLDNESAKQWLNHHSVKQ